MATIQCDLEDQVAQTLNNLASARGIDAKTLAEGILSRFARSEWCKQAPVTAELVKQATGFAAEDAEFAEAGMAEYAKTLEAEDQA